MYIPTQSITNFITLKRRLNRSEIYQFSVVTNNILLYEILRIVYREFKIKALKGADSMGRVWAPTTVALEKWKRKTKKPIKRINGRVGINVRYGDLISSVKPGPLVNYLYQPTEFQRVTINSKGADFWITLAYADEVNLVRPFIPDDIREWIEMAIQNSIPRLKRYLRERGLLGR